MEEADRGEGRAEDRGAGPEADVEPVGDDRGGDETAADRVQPEERGQAGDRPRVEGCPFHGRGLHPRRKEDWKPGREHSDRGIEKVEEAGQRHVGGQRRGEAATRPGEGTGQRVAGEGEVAAPGRDRFGKHRLLDRQERANVEPRRPQHAGDAAQDEDQVAGSEEQDQAGAGHQQADEGKRRTPAEAARERGDPESGKGGREQADGQAEANLGRFQAVAFEVDAEEHSRTAEPESSDDPAEEQQTVVIYQRWR